MCMIKKAGKFPIRYGIFQGLTRISKNRRNVVINKKLEKKSHYSHFKR